jgi:hypothetical protein
VRAARGASSATSPRRAAMLSLGGFEGVVLGTDAGEEVLVFGIQFLYRLDQKPPSSTFRDDNVQQDKLMRILES